MRPKTAGPGSWPIAFRRAIIEGELAEFTCLVGTMVQEVHAEWPSIRDACGASIFGHAATLEADIAAAMAGRAISPRFSPASLARHTQTRAPLCWPRPATTRNWRAKASITSIEYFQLIFGRPVTETDAR